jgi:ABC-type lipoprotein release transport system permease subunit
MRLSGLIARRYLVSRSNRNAVNIITGISLLGFAVGSFALIVILSALNGFEGLLFRVYNDFHPDLKVTPVAGKMFTPDSATIAHIRKLPGITYVGLILEDNAVLQSGNQQVICTLKGTDSGFLYHSGIDKHLLAGGTLNPYPGISGVILGEGLEYRLGLMPGARDVQVSAVVPRRESVSLVNPEVNKLPLLHTGTMRMDDEINNRYAIVPVAYAEHLFERYDERSGLELFLKPGASLETIRTEVQNLLGSNFLIQDRREQNKALLHMFRTEKWATFAILCFVLAVISFNLTGALSMLVIEKKNDIRTLHIMGAQPTTLSAVFLKEGLLISGIGALSGMLLGVLLVVLQQQIGFIRMDSAIVPYYPVALRFSDMVLVAAVALVMGLLSALYPSLQVKKHL